MLIVVPVEEYVLLLLSRPLLKCEHSSFTFSSFLSRHYSSFNSSFHISSFDTSVIFLSMVSIRTCTDLLYYYVNRYILKHSS